MRDRVKEAMSAVFGLPAGDIPDDASPETLEDWDSLRHLELMLELEMAFGVRIPAEQVPELITVDAIVEALEEHGAS
jgi:acyl carrier protein